MFRFRSEQELDKARIELEDMIKEDSGREFVHMELPLRLVKDWIKIKEKDYCLHFMETKREHSEKGYVYVGKVRNPNYKTESKRTQEKYNEELGRYNAEGGNEADDLVSSIYPGEFARRVEDPRMEEVPRFFLMYVKIQKK